MIRVHAPWIKSIYFMDEQTYVIPNSQTVVSALLPCLLGTVFSCPSRRLTACACDDFALRCRRDALRCLEGPATWAITALNQQQRTAMPSGRGACSWCPAWPRWAADYFAQAIITHSMICTLLYSHTGLQAQTVREWVGLRPGRPCVRLETEMMNVTGRGSPLPVVHNYGHGGAGLTLAHGCAAHATRLARELLEQQSARAKL